jgi:hypothetical protein
MAGAAGGLVLRAQHLCAPTAGGRVGARRALLPPLRLSSLGSAPPSCACSMSGRTHARRDLSGLHPRERVPAARVLLGPATPAHRFSPSSSPLRSWASGSRAWRSLWRSCSPSRSTTTGRGGALGRQKSQTYLERRHSRPGPRATQHSKPAHRPPRLKLSACRLASLHLCAAAGTRSWRSMAWSTGTRTRTTRRRARPASLARSSRAPPSQPSSWRGWLRWRLDSTARWAFLACRTSGPAGPAGPFTLHECSKQRGGTAGRG